MSENLGRAVARLETKVDILLDRSKGIDNRVRELEKRSNWIKGAIAIIGVAWPLALIALGGKV